MSESIAQQPIRDDALSVNDQLMQQLPVSLAQVAKLLAERGVPIFVDAEGGSVLATLIEGEILFMVNENMDTISFRGLWNRVFSSARYRNAADTCNEWNAYGTWARGYASEPSVDENRAVRMFCSGQIMNDDRDDVMGMRIDDVLNVSQIFFSWLGEQYPDPIRIPDAPYGRKA
ncbi:hypothetical protein [Bombiscardovia coagulans]|uniref:Sensory transduction regulator n=1 Tax=Bombiscardovia coagulans TaxID=686666 RepID=A0A261EPG8_9BIFI|nr:hypothetical protein [Bombiscardovia coagulans]OZG48737.1 hypothetical protein BOCO_1433 [Bombiscardovia coagulans]